MVYGRITMDTKSRTGCITWNEKEWVIDVIDFKLYDELSVNAHQWFYDVYTVNCVRLW